MPLLGAKFTTVIFPAEKENLGNDIWHLTDMMNCTYVINEFNLSLYDNILITHCQRSHYSLNIVEIH